MSSSSVQMSQSLREVIGQYENAVNSSLETLLWISGGIVVLGVILGIILTIRYEDGSLVFLSSIAGIFFGALIIFTFGALPSFDYEEDLEAATIQNITENYQIDDVDITKTIERDLLEQHYVVKATGFLESTYTDFTMRYNSQYETMMPVQDDPAAVLPVREGSNLETKMSASAE